MPLSLLRDTSNSSQHSARETPNSSHSPSMGDTTSQHRCSGSAADALQPADSSSTSGGGSGDHRLPHSTGSSGAGGSFVFSQPAAFPSRK